MKLTEEQINALTCAVAVFEGTDGGYSPNEKSAAKQELMKLLQQAWAEWRADKIAEQAAQDDALPSPPAEEGKS